MTGQVRYWRRVQRSETASQVAGHEAVGSCVPAAMRGRDPDWGSAHQKIALIGTSGRKKGEAADRQARPSPLSQPLRSTV